jgi:hypothetical protein
MLCPLEKYFYLFSLARWIERDSSVNGLVGGMDSRAFAEWQRKTSLPESGL